MYMHMHTYTLHVYVHIILAGCLPWAGCCYGESAPASFDVCELVATEGSCYNDGRVEIQSLDDSESNRPTTGSHGSDN